MYFVQIYIVKIKVIINKCAQNNLYYDKVVKSILNHTLDLLLYDDLTLIIGSGSLCAFSHLIATSIFEISNDGFLNFICI